VSPRGAVRAGSGLAAAFLAAAAATAASPAFEREVAVDAPGRVAVRLDREVYEAARPDLGDLRVLDASGRLVPFLIDRGASVAHAAGRRPQRRNFGWTARGEATADFDFGGPAPKSRLRLRLSGDNFRRAVSVAGSADGREWTTLVDQAWVFAVPGEDPARYETIELPPNDFALLRVRVRPGPDERGRVSIEDAWMPGEVLRPAREEAVEPRLARAEDAERHETWLTLDLGAAHQPFHAVELEIGDGRFFREALVEARREDPARDGRPGSVSWTPIGRGALYRLGDRPRPAERTRLAVSGRERVLRVRLLNRDDRPLDVRAVRVWAPVERVVFEAGRGSEYRLVYGSADRAPEFDLARTVDDVAAWAAGASEAGLGPPRKRAAAAGGDAPWTDRHPAVLWTGLVAVVAALGALTWRAVRGS
jgi:hypothetical protein